MLKIGTFLQPVSPNPALGLASLLSAEPLVTVNWDGRPVNRLMASAADSADGRTLTVTLKRDIRFHSGELVTAARVRELILPKLRNFARQDVRDVVAVGEDKLEFHLHRPYALKPADFSVFLVDTDATLNLRTGPFKIVSAGPPLVLERFDGYDQGPPSAVTRIEIMEYPTHRAAWSAMLRGDVNFLHEVNRDAIDFLEAGGQFKAYPLLRPFYVPLVFNVRHPVLGRRDVRVALDEAIDREEVLSNGMRGHGEVAEGPFWPRHWAYPHGRVPVTHNPEAARIRLDAGGLRVNRRNNDGMPARFSFTCLVPLGDPRFERIALVVQRQLFAIGVDMRLQALPVREFLGHVASGKFDALIFEMTATRTFKFPYDFWHSKGAHAFSGYAAADEALDRIKFARTDDEVRLAVLDAMRILRADPPAVFLAYPREVRAANRAFDIPYQTDHDIFYTLRQTRWRTTAEPAAPAGPPGQ